MFRRLSSGVKWGVLVGAILCGILLFWKFSPAPVPGLHSAAAAADKIAAMPQSEQRVAAHHYGGLVARSSSWKSMAERGSALPAHVQDVYFSAVAYSGFIDDTHTDEVLTQLSAHVPVAYRSVFCNSLARIYASEHAKDPPLVLAYRSDLSASCGDADLTDGIHQGIQEAFPANLSEAFSIVKSYPTPQHRSLIEKLGWRIGEDVGMDVETWRSAEEVVTADPTSQTLNGVRIHPHQYLCALAAGVTLGAMHRLLVSGEPWTPAFIGFHEALPRHCQEAAVEGLADSFIFVLGPHEPALDAKTAELEDARLRLQLTEQLAIRVTLQEVRMGEPASRERLAALPEGQRWHAAHLLGFLAGHEHGYEAVALFSRAIPPTFSDAFHDGLAHGVEPDWAQPEAWVQSIQTMIPADHQQAHVDALVRIYTTVHVEEPDKVVAFAARVSQLTGGRSLDNGVRIGFQQALGADIPQAMRVMKTYPAAMQRPILEELGWRLGEDEGLSRKAWSEGVQTLDETAGCMFGAGMVRGVMLQKLRLGEEWVNPTSAFTDGLPPACLPLVQQGVAAALLIVLGHDQVAIEAAIRRTPYPDELRTLVARIREQPLTTHIQTAADNSP